MHKVRDCNPDACGWESKCGGDSACYICGEKQYSGNCGAPCGSSAQMHWTKTCTITATGQQEIVEGCDTPNSCSLCGNGTCGSNETYLTCPGDCSGAALWSAYGFALPGDSDYGLGYPDPYLADMLGLAAKGNIIIGNYLDPNFYNNVVVKKLKPGDADEDGQNSVVQPYAIDPSDEALGYLDFYEDGLPKFSGDYDRQDREGLLPGTKEDGTPRKFYESTLSDAKFQALIVPDDDLYYGNSSAAIDAILYTNHALTGLVGADTLTINGAVVARDDAVLFNDYFLINHDTRLFDKRMANQIVLPFGLKRPKLIKWEVSSE